MTRKEFVVQIVNDLKENPKAILRGHGLRPNFLQTLTTRDDILGKIAGFAFSTKLAVKGKKALRKQNNMRVFAYKDFIMFNRKAREDVQTFMDGLSPEDAGTFTNSNNVLVILALPDTGDAGSVEENISMGKSIMLSFDSAVKKEYKIPGGMYYVIMFGDSVIRPVEAKKAAAKEAVNERKVRIASSPAKIKNALVKKAKAKMAVIANKDRRLKRKATTLSAELGEVNAYARQLGVDPNADAGTITAAQRGFNRRTTAGAGALKAARIDEHNRAINTIRMKNRYLVQNLQDATTAKARADIRFAIKKNKQRIEDLQARIALYDNFSAKTIKNKAKILSDVNAEIEANLAAGQTITSSLNSALAKLNIAPQQKQQIAQQVIEDIADNGTDLQLAAQQAMQEILPAQVEMQQLPAEMVIEAPVAKPRAPRRKARSIEEILNSPVEPLISGDLVDDAFSDSFVAQKAPQFSKTQELQRTLSII